MIGVVVVTHGQLATELVNAAETIVGDLPRFAAVSIGLDGADTFQAGPHGLSEVLYNFASASNNNGSAFAGISANTPWYNTTLGVAMVIGRFMVIIPMLALAGSLGRKTQSPPSLGTFPVTTPLFATLLVGVIVIVGVLTFFPVLSLGPIVEHFLMQAGKVF